LPKAAAARPNFCRRSLRSKWGSGIRLVVIVDSQNKMLQEIKSKFPDAIMIDPEINPPSLDLFSPNGFDDSPSLAPTLDTFKYLFEAGAQPLTDRQYTPFSYGIARWRIVPP
jgi:hypothetical protein